MFLLLIICIFYCTYNIFNDSNSFTQQDLALKGSFFLRNYEQLLFKQTKILQTKCNIYNLEIESLPSNTLVLFVNLFLYICYLELFTLYQFKETACCKKDKIFFRHKNHTFISSLIFPLHFRGKKDRKLKRFKIILKPRK